MADRSSRPVADPDVGAELDIHGRHMDSAARVQVVGWPTPGDALETAPDRAAYLAAPLFAANNDAEPAPDLSADRSEVREGLETEARGRKLLAESEELVADGALRVGSALAKIKKKVPPGLWLRELAALRIKQPTAWYYMQFAEIKTDDDRAAYLWRNGFSVRKAVDEY